MKPPYEITQKILFLYGQITEALALCKTLLLVKPEARLRKQNRIKTIYSSLFIEGNTLDIEHVTALIENSHVVGPKKDILEVKNAIAAYDQLQSFNSYSVKDFLKAHGIMMNGLVEHSGKFRKTQVGILKGKEVHHIAPGYAMVPGLMNDLFEYLKKDEEINIIKSCVFHYEMEFIHPFEDGNGRMGRFWQTRLLMEVNPIFEYVPMEEVIKNNQQEYYSTLAESDNSGNSTVFIEFMLDVINKSIRNMINETKAVSFNYQKRTEYAFPLLNEEFGRKDYMLINKGLSTATASRDLKQLVAEGKIKAIGTGRITRYKKNG